MKVFLILTIIVLVAVLCALFLYCFYNKVNSTDPISSVIPNGPIIKDHDTDYKNFIDGERVLKPRVLQLNDDDSFWRNNEEKQTKQLRKFSKDSNSKNIQTKNKKGAKSRNKMNEEFSKFLGEGFSWLNRGIEEYKKGSMSDKADTKREDEDREKFRREEIGKNWNHGLRNIAIGESNENKERNINFGMGANSMDEDDNTSAKENVNEQKKNGNGDLIEKGITVEDLEDKNLENEGKSDNEEEFQNI